MADCRELEEIVKRVVINTVEGERLLTRDDASNLIATTIASTLLQMGIKTDELVEVQRDNAFIRDLRISRDKLKELSWSTVLKTLILGGLALLALGLSTKLHLGQ
jgi:hypothetical protein